MNVIQTIVDKMNYYVEQGDHQKEEYLETGEDKFHHMEWFYYSRALALCDLLWIDLDAISESEYENIVNHIYGI